VGARARVRAGVGLLGAGSGALLLAKMAGREVGEVSEVGEVRGRGAAFPQTTGRLAGGRGMGLTTGAPRGAQAP
jgi:hypothetical protein